MSAPNLTAMTPSEVAEALPSLFEDNIPVFIHGKSGIGKSSVVRQVAAKMKRDFIDVRASQLSEVDLRGLPMFDTKTKQAVWYPPDFLPTPTAKASILFLDELNLAHPAVLATCYQLILDRRIGNYTLPDNCSVLAAGNTVTDRGNIHSIPAPLNNRFLHIDYTLNADDFQRQSTADELHAHIRTYLRLHNDALHCFDSLVNPRAFPTPRSWYTADKVYKNPNYSNSVRFKLLAGAIGEGTATTFMGWVKNLKDMPDIDAILLNPREAKLPTSQPVMHAVITTLVDKSKASNYSKLMLYVARLPREIQMVFNSYAVVKDPNITANKDYTTWCLENKRLMGVS
jgi:hypothetical protein